MPLLCIDERVEQKNGSSAALSGRRFFWDRYLGLKPRAESLGPFGTMRVAPFALSPRRRIVPNAKRRTPNAKRQTPNAKRRTATTASPLFWKSTSAGQ